MSKKCHFLFPEVSEGQPNAEHDFIAGKYSYDIQQMSGKRRKAADGTSSNRNILRANAIAEDNCEGQAGLKTGSLS